MSSPTDTLERTFAIGDRSSSVRKEVVGGVTTFLTMAYILFVNPAVLGGEGGLPFAQVLTVTALAAGVMTIAMGAVANYPFAIAAGLGLNAVVAFNLVAAQGLTYPEAMGVVVAEGLIIAVLVLTGFREAVMDAIPVPLKLSIGAGIGLFIALIGFVNGGLIVQNEGTGALGLADMGSLRVGVFVAGLLLMSVLVARRVRAALLYGIATTTFAAIAVNGLAGGGLWTTVGEGVAQMPSQIVALPDFSLVGQFSFGFIGQLGLIGSVLAVYSLLLADFFDTMGTVIGLGGEAGFLDEETRLPRIRRVLLVDSLAAAFGGAVSASSNTTYIESATGISEGARTGLASIVTGVLFLAAMFFSPLAGVIPPEATAPALILVGFLMLAVVRDIDWGDAATGIPAFLTMIVMPFTYSITDGIGAGFVSWTVLAYATGRGRSVHWLMSLASALFVVYFALAPIREALGV